MKKNSLLFITVLLSFISACQKTNHEEEALMTKEIIKDMEVVSSARVFFGHQSVGQNLISGLEALSKTVKGADLSIMDFQGFSERNGGYFVHTKVGENLQPASKCFDFQRLIDQELSGKIDFALLKFCYVDILKDSDINKIFDNYKATMNGLIERHPSITFIHVTVPLMQNPTGVKAWLKEVLGKTSDKQLDNIKRNQFNQLLYSTYGSSYIFDIAKSESTFPDGSRQSFQMNGETYYSLINGYTYDGGHLNDQGQLHVATDFIRIMADVIKDRKISNE